MELLVELLLDPQGLLVLVMPEHPVLKENKDHLDMMVLMERMDSLELEFEDLKEKLDTMEYQVLMESQESPVQQEDLELQEKMVDQDMMGLMVNLEQLEQPVLQVIRQVR